MLLTVTLNAAVDKTYQLNGFALDRVHRPSEWRIVAGGKGINVARVFRRLGGEAVATGFLGGYNGRFIEKALSDEGLPGKFVETEDESRVCIAIIDTRTGTQTELNEVGPAVTASEVEALKRRYSQLLDTGRIDRVALCGSIPPGVPDTIYAELIAEARRYGVGSLLDASGEALKHGVEAHPWMIKPNIHELEALVGRSLATEHEAADAARSLTGTVSDIICVTRGRDSALCIADEGCWSAAPPDVEFVSAVGSGDSFVAGFLRSLERSGSTDGSALAEALKRGVAAGAANAAAYGAGFIEAAEVERLSRSVEVRPL